MLDAGSLETNSPNRSGTHYNPDLNFGGGAPSEGGASTAYGVVRHEVLRHDEMKTTPLDILDVLLFEPTVFEDARGFFFESFHQAQFEAAVGRPGGKPVNFVQDNHSRSTKGVLRGLHYQIKQPQGKLIRVIWGEVFDVAVDLRQSSPTFGRWVGKILSAENRCQLWVPEGFAHGFLVLSEAAEVLYKTTDYYAPVHERSIVWNDPTLDIRWPIEGEPSVSEKDKKAPPFSKAVYFA